MTINVAVKCPDGIVLGADSLVSIMLEGPTPRAFAPNHHKLFQLGKLPAGVLLNGQTAINGQILEDIIAEFGASLGTIAAGQPFDLEATTGQLRGFVTTKIGTGPPPGLQLIVGGYSQGKKNVRYGEIYTITWPGGDVEDLYAGDRNFGAYFGGRPDPIYRFLSGFDRFTAKDMALRWRKLYEQTRDYIFQEIEQAGQQVPASLKDLPVPPLRDINPWSLVSDHDLTNDQTSDLDELLTRVAEHSRLPYAPAYGFFSLQTAVNFAWQMLLVAYAESNFLPQLPMVGSKLRIATVTRDRGFERVWSGEPNIPLRG